MSDTIELRKMTWKSMLHEGKYPGHSIQQVFDLKHTRYLRFIYYNYARLTFTDEILDAIHIPKDMRIDKPGKNPAMFDDLNTELIISLKTRRKLDKRMAGFQKEKERFAIRRITNKAINKSKNQGGFRI